MNKPIASASRPFVLIAVVALTVLSTACGLFAPRVDTPTPEPSATPRPTSTTVPARPVVPYTPVPSDMLSPILLQRSPKQGQALPPDGRIELVFDKPMDRQTVASALQVERAGGGEAVSGALSWANDRTVSFRPNTALPRGTTFDVILTQDAKALSGEPLREPYAFRFSTVGPLEVAQVIPAPGSEDVETDATITVIFNRPVVPLTTIAEMASFPDPLMFEPAVEGTGEWLNTSIYVFKLDEPLAGGIAYRVTVSADLEDLSGATLLEPYMWRFSTVPPKVSWVRPREDTTLVDINTAITVEFNQPVSPASAQGAFSLRGSGVLATAVRGSYRVEDSTLTFTPTAPLDFDTRYTVEVDAGVTSTAGGRGMTDPYTWEFTTVPLPRIVETFPADGDRDASPYTDFRIVFNAPIDPATVMPNLTMSPPLSVTQVHTYFSQYDNTFVLYFGAEPSTDYTVEITDGIADPYGNTIPRGRTVRFRTAALPPTYQLRTPDFVGTYDAGLPAQLVVGHINLTRLSLRLYTLPSSALTTSPWEWQDRDKTLPRDALIREWEETLQAPLNEQRYTVIDLTEAAAGTLSPGLYLLDVAAPEIRQDEWRRTQRHLLVVSELNLTLKNSPADIMVWAVDLASGDPVPNLDLNVIDLYDGLRERVRTGGDGIARLELPRDYRNLIVMSEEPFAAVSSEWGRGIGPWDFGVSEGVSAQSYRTYLYTDRTIYRPGQTVTYKGVIRAEDDAEYSLPGLSAVEIVIRSATGEEIASERLPLSELGTFAGSVTLSEGAPLGEYVISAEFADGYGQTFFTVAAYRAPEFQTTVAFDRDEYQRGDNLQATVELAYFFGGPLADTEVAWTVLAEPATFEPPWGGRYTFSDTDDPYRCFDCWWWYEPPSPEPLLSGRGMTDSAGQLSVTVNGQELAELLDKGTRRVTFEATATGPDNQEIAGRTAATVHPGPYYIGLQPRTYVSQAGDESEIDLIAVDWQGERLPGREVKVSFYRYEWVNTFIENDSGGGRWTWETKETWVAEATATTDNLGEAVASFVPETGGTYHVIAEPAAPTSETEAIRSSIFIWVAGEDTVAWRRENHDRITLVSDKTTYEVGETAEILIPSPLEAPHLALITVEREGIRRYDTLRLENNSAIYRLPIEEGDIPNIYVSVVLVAPRRDGPAEFKMGLLPLEVSTAPKTLSVEVAAEPQQAQPGDEVTYALTARDPAGNPVAGAELSLDVVDKAVLSLKPRTEDILSSLYARRQLEVATASALSVSVNRYQEELAEDLDLTRQAADAFGMGGGAEEEAAEEPVMEAPMAPEPTAMDDAGEGASRGLDLPPDVAVREEFNDTAAWRPQLITDDAGRAAVTIKLPDNTTTWVARAVGLTASTLVGENKAEVVATKPLLIRPVAPRFFVVDDRAQLAANVSNNTAETLEVAVRLSSTGVVISDETAAEQTVSIPPRSETKVTWWVTVTDVPESELVFSAMAGDYADASKPRLTTGPEGSLLVLRYTAPDTVGTAGQLVEGGAQTEAIALPPEYDDRRGQLTVQLDPSLAAGMQEGLDYLEHYEYECTEQTVSRFLPNVLTYNALQSLGIDNPELAEKLPDLVEEGLAKLRSQQNPDGGWGWWHRPQRRESNAYVSAYVVFALLKADAAGFQVDAQMLAAGIDYLQSQIAAVRDLDHYREANRQAWLLYVLAEASAANRNDIDVLYENRDKLSTYARAYLAQAIWLDAPGDARLSTLLSDLNNAAIMSATGAHWEESNYDWWAMNTDTRSTAIVLDTLA
ncbi:MAG: Ig-like domain-containing protein, partial [Anaerolineae bacterium]|nr:Ig-like domain-containing protein [Anaerolineae bacterium]